MRVKSEQRAVKTNRGVPTPQVAGGTVQVVQTSVQERISECFVEVLRFCEQIVDVSVPQAVECTSERTVEQVQRTMEQMVTGRGTVFF